MQNFPVVLGVILGIMTVAIWLGGAVWFMSDLHTDWETKTKQINDIEAHLKENREFNEWLKNAMCKHDRKLKEMCD